MDSGIKISKQLLKSVSGEFDLESIHSLVLRDQEVSDLGCIGECIALERLDLAMNDVSKLYSLAGLTNLVYLNLSANRISSLEGLQSLDSLESINLAGNLISSMSTVGCLGTLEKLHDVRLLDTVHELSNPICMNTSYKRDILQQLPNLVILDGERLSGKGSELFQLCDELDKMLCNNNESFDVGQISHGPWIQESEWKRSDKFEKSHLGDAEQQLEELLSQCHKVSMDAETKIQNFLEKDNPL